MFSGIVQETGKVIEFVKEKDIYNLSIDSSSEFISGLKKGASVSVNGVCLTVKDANPEVLRFDLVEETIKKWKRLDALVFSSSVKILRFV